MNYIIDGYNLGFADPKIVRWIQRGDSDRAIQLIIQKVRGIIPKSSKAIIVFDGRHGYFTKQYNLPQIQVIFSKKPETADDIIRRIIRHEANPQLWNVISSDHEIQNTARDMGAKITKSSKAIHSGLEFKKPNAEDEPKEKFNPSPEDIEFWLEQFSGDKDS